MSLEGTRIETKLIHGSKSGIRINGAIVSPIFQSSTYEFDTITDYHSIRYIRFNNTPNQVLLGQKLAELEEAEEGLVTGSGTAAIVATLLTVLAPGDHLITLDSIYGGTQSFIRHDLARLGITHSDVNAEDLQQWQQCLKPTTKAIYVETMTNPLLRIPDLGYIAAFAKNNGLVSIIDNTFATPLNFRPCRAGYDISVHSCSKYLNGHNDIVAGVVLGRSSLVRRIKQRLDCLGGPLDPHACFLLERGMKTLAVRLRAQERSAMLIASFLDDHPAIVKVHYPGLKSHPQHERARHLFDGFGAMISFEPAGGVEAAESLLRNLTIPIIAPSLGGAESLIIRPAGVIYVDRSPEDRAQSGIADGLLRLSVGLENTEDLIADFRDALALLPRIARPSREKQST